MNIKEAISKHKDIKKKFTPEEAWIFREINKAIEEGNPSISKLRFRTLSPETLKRIKDEGYTFDTTNMYPVISGWAKE